MESSLGFFSWIIFGALAGWVAAKLAGDDDQTGCLTNIIVGVIGAFLGGFIWSTFFGDQVVFQWSIGAFIVAVIGAIVLLLIVRLIRKI